MSSLLPASGLRTPASSVLYQKANQPLDRRLSQRLLLPPVNDQLRSCLRCLVSIGMGVPALMPVWDDVLGIGATLTNLGTETEKTAEQFRRDKSSLDDEGRYYRFIVSHGLEDVGLEESKKQREMAAATGRYVASQDVFKQMRACANSLARKQC